MKYTAIINVPGYLPTDDEPPVFDTPAEAWQYLADERERGEGRWLPDDPDDPDGPASEDPTYACLWHHANTEDPYVCGNRVTHWPHFEGTLYGTTPGYEGEHDLGVAYTVQATDTDEE